VELSEGTAPSTYPVHVPDERAPLGPAAITRNTRLAGVGAVAFSALAWWPAFSLGAYGQIFFDQFLALWAAATAAFVVVLAYDSRVLSSRWKLASLLLPSVWILLSMLALRVTPGGGWEAALAVLGTAITLVGLPVMAAVLVRVAVPEVESALTRRQRAAVVAAVTVVVVLAFLLGRGQSLFLTCYDFSVSGNTPPAGCTPGGSSLGQGP
jgi:hypothetical protein